MGTLHDLSDQQGQSPWLDNLRRGWLTGGEMQEWLDRGVRGLTSNPSIFANAMIKTDDYDAALEGARPGGDAGGGRVLGPRRFRHSCRPCPAHAGARSFRTARTATSRWRSPPRSPTTKRPPSAPPANSTTGSKLRTSTSRCPQRRRACPPSGPSSARTRSINVTLIFALSRYQGRDGGLPRRARRRGG